MRRRGVLLLLPVLATVVACGGSSGGPAPTRTVDYLPGLGADVFRPAQRLPGAPTVVLVPGGAWRSADRSGLRPLAARLAAGGVPAVAATYRVGTDDARFPVPVQDIACAAAFAAHRLGGPVVLLGHSSGAQLAAVTALTAAPPAARCRWPAARVTGLIGLAGPYDLRAVAEAAQPLVGAPPARAPRLWAAADPVRLAAGAPPYLRVLLLHGEQDTLVPPADSRLFARALTGAAVPTRLELVPGAGHDEVYRAGVAGPRVLRWLRQLSSSTISMAPAGHSTAQMPQPLQ